LAFYRNNLLEKNRVIKLEIKLSDLDKANKKHEILLWVGLDVMSKNYIIFLY
jgi:hypothetical protein